MGNKCVPGRFVFDQEAEGVRNGHYKRAAKEATIASPFDQSSEHLLKEERAAHHNPHRCTDLFCALLFFACMAGVGKILWYARDKADLRRLSHGLDWKGDLCGVSEDVVDKPYLYWCAKAEEPESSGVLVNPVVEASMQVSTSTSGEAAAAPAPAFSPEAATTTEVPPTARRLLDPALATDLNKQLALVSSATSPTTTEPAASSTVRYTIDQLRAQSMAVQASLAGSVNSQLGNAASVLVGSAVFKASEKLDLEHPICVSKCPTSIETKRACLVERSTVRKDNITVSGTFQEITTYEMKYVEDYPSFSLNDQYCIPKDKSVTQLMSKLDAGLEGLVFKFGQLMKAWEPLLAAALISLTLGYLYLLTAKYVSGPLIYTMITLAVVLPIAAGCYLLFGLFQEDASDAWATHINREMPSTEALFFPTTGNRTWDTIISASLICLGIVVAIASCILHRKIELILGVIEATVDCLFDVPAMLMHPMWMVITRMTVLALAIVGFGWLITMGEVENYQMSGYVPSGLTRSFALDDVQQSMVAFYVFGAAWFVEFMRAMDEFVFCYATQRWYFTEYNRIGRKSVSILVTLRGYMIGTVYHLGSLAFGSFLLALFRVAEMVLSYLYDQAKDAIDDDGGVIKCCAAGCCCCLQCFENLIRFLNKNAYLVVAIESVDFCQASQLAFNLCMTELAEVAVLEGATCVFQVLGMVSITASTTYLTWAMCLNVDRFSSQESEHFVHSPEIVTATAGVISAVIAFCFTFVFDVVSDSILFCYALDRKVRQDNNLGPNDNLPATLQNLLDHDWVKSKAARYQTREMEDLS